MRIKLDWGVVVASRQFAKTWWGEKWLNALEGVYLTNRIGRGRTYANTGRVFDINISGNAVTAKETNR